MWKNWTERVEGVLEGGRVTGRQGQECRELRWWKRRGDLVTGWGDVREWPGSFPDSWAHVSAPNQQEARGMDVSEFTSWRLTFPVITVYFGLLRPLSPLRLSLLFPSPEVL